MVLCAIADVRDETVARFAAARFRSTYRSLRPLLENRSGSEFVREEDTGDKATDQSRARRHTQQELDEDAKSFALGLIENWIEDPSNVRLLRIGLDLWPTREILEGLNSTSPILGEDRPTDSSEEGGFVLPVRNFPRWCD